MLNPVAGVVAAVLITGLVVGVRWVTADPFPPDGVPTPPHDRRATDRRLTAVERKLVVGIRASILYGVIITLGFSFAVWRIEQLVTEQDQEAQERRLTVSQLIEQGCNTDNGQDLLLARLISASLEGNGTFGQGVDPSTLTPFDLQVLATIAKVTQSQQDQPDALTRKFQRVLRRLRDLTDCAALVASFLSGTPIPQLGVAAGHPPEGGHVSRDRPPPGG